MDTPGLPLFSADALAVLDGMPFDPVASVGFEVMSGEMMWSDEFPPAGSPGWAAISPNWMYRYLLAYRASITLGEERTEYRPVWDQVVRRAPNWPGLRPERRSESALRRLRVALRQQGKCLTELESWLELRDPND